MGVQSQSSKISQTYNYGVSEDLRARLAVRLGDNKIRLLCKESQRVVDSTALHYAARRGDMEIVELLLEHGAKPSIKNDLGRDVLS